MRGVCPRIHDQAVEPETAGLEAVVGVHKVVVLERIGFFAGQDAAAQGLQIDRDGRCPFDRERRVAHAQLDRAVFGLGPDVPVEVLHAVHDAGVFHLREVLAFEAMTSRARRAPVR
jgi:hypothetical protein